MVKESNYLVSEREDGIRYVVGGNYLYVSGGMYQLESIQQYVRGKRGVYVLIGGGSYYVGEGLVYERLISHRTHKKWVEEVYVVVKGGQENMDKEESLRFEGSLDTYMCGNSNLEQENKDRTRDDEYDIEQHVKRLSWVGLDISKKQYYGITKRDGKEVIILKKANLQYEIINIEGSLSWLEGKHFEKLEDIKNIIEVLDKEVDVGWI